MSFGFSISDIVGLIQLTTKTIQGAQRACGEYNELTRGVNSLQDVLSYLHSELKDPDSLTYQLPTTRKSQLRNHIAGCEMQLRDLYYILKKYNALGDEERSKTSVWQKIRFGNGPVTDVSEIRLKLSTYTSLITISLQMVSIGSQGRIEKGLGRHSGQLRGIQEALDLLLAKRTAMSREGSRAEGSTTSIYSNDEPAFWKGLRRDLNKQKFPSRVLKPHKQLILDYVKELGETGVLDNGMGLSRTSLNSYGDTGFMEMGAIHESDDRLPFVPEDPEGFTPSSYQAPVVTDQASSFLSHPEDEVTWPVAFQSNKPTYTCSARPQATCEDESVEELQYVYETTPPRDLDPVSASESLPIDADMNLQTPELSSQEPSRASQVSEELAEMARRIEELEILNRQQQEALEAATRLSIELGDPEPITTVNHEEELEVESTVSSEEIQDSASEERNYNQLLPKHESIDDVDLQRGIVPYNGPDEQDRPENEQSSSKESTPIRVFDFQIVNNKPAREASPSRVKPRSPIVTPNSNDMQIAQYQTPEVRMAEFLLLPLEERKKTISFKDAVGRRYVWPFHLVKTWKGLVELIEEAFAHVQDIGFDVREGRFDILNPDGGIILPQVWSSVVVPSQLFVMAMWPKVISRRTPPIIMLRDLRPQAMPLPLSRTNKMTARPGRKKKAWF